MNNLIFRNTVLSILTLLLVVALTTPVFAVETRTITARKLKFHPDKIKIPVDEKVQIKMVNDGYVSHSYDIPKLDIKTHSVQPDSYVVATFTPQKKGKYEFICDVAEHKKAGMKGTIIVEDKSSK